LTVADWSQAIDIDEIAAGLPRRIHDIAARWVDQTPDHVALVEDGASWTYRELDRPVAAVAADLASLGIRAGDRMIIVSETCIALAALLLAGSRIDARAIVANPRLSPRELHQVRDHSGARRMFFTSAVSKEAAAHASRCNAESRSIGPLRSIGVTALNEGATAEPVERDAAKQVAVVVPRGELRERAHDAAIALTKRPAGSLGLTKKLMRDHQRIAAQIAEERQLLKERLKTPEAREAFAAFAERRPPDFTKLRP
jgi:acyl-CoA synthetase (AMP-forming)/AMP-acid ligase II